MKQTKLFVLAMLAACAAWLGCSFLHPSTIKPDAASIAFYNVENLFDTEDDPSTLDEDFTPNGKQQWTAGRYQTKLDHLAKVVEGLGFPALLGVAEIENSAVLKDFAEKTVLKPHGYGFAHFDSPDIRGIDVALFYQKKVFKVLKAETIRIQFPADIIADQPDYTTRDILVVKGILNKKDTLNLLVAHLPSRRGGVKESEPKRIYVARQIRQKVDEIFKQNKNANIAVMGDFNDEPADECMADVLKAQPFKAGYQPATLYNCFSELKAAGAGSYKYRGDWNMLDQIILSGNLLNPANKLHFSKPAVFQQEWMLYEDKTYGKAPSRTYGGERYFGGCSDHLPVKVER